MRLMLAACCLLTAGCFAVPAYAQAQCGSRAEIVQQLTDHYAETVAGLGLANQGVVEIWTGANGSWTMTISPPNGIACVIAAGEGWEMVTPKPKGQGS